MKLSIEEMGILGNPTTAILEHNGEKISWNICLFDKMSMGDNIDPFEQINGYWLKVPMDTQNKIFAIYKRIKDVFDSVWNTTELTKELYVLVKDLYDLNDIADIRHWIDFHSTLALPDGLKDSFKESHETPGTRERTYLKEDYKWLVALSVALRAMIPIWGEFIARTKKEAGTVFKEYYAFKLLAFSNISKCEPMERLRIYVEHSLPSDKSKSAAILGGLSSEDFPTWILALVTIRRLSIGDVRGIDPKSSLVTFIYKFIGQKAQGHDNSFIGMVKEKITEGQGQDGENNLSKLEGYKVKQEIPAGDIAIISHYLNNVHELARKICPNISIELVDMSIANMQSLNIEQIWKPQIILTQWVLKAAIPPRGLLLINKTLSLKAMGVAQAILIHKEHFELAGLLSAIEQDNDDELSMGGSDSRARITKDQIAQLDVLYPFSRKPIGKQKVLKLINPAVDAIDSMAVLFSAKDWRLTLPNELVVKITNNPNNRRYSTPYNIKNLLADLVISIANRSFYK